MDIVKKLIIGILLGCLLAGTVIALMGLYSDIFNVSVIGFFLILISLLIAEILRRKSHILD